MQDKTTTYSAPGKAILFGEHAVVYGYPAIVMAIGLRSYCAISDSTKKTIQLSIPNIDSEHTFYYNGENLVFRNNKTSSSKIALSSLNYIIKTLFEKTNKSKSPSITVKSDIPIGVGLGSSAAVAVSTITSLSDYFGLDYSLKKVNQIAFNSEQITHGNPSGIDNTISTFGGIQYFKKEDIRKLLVKKIPYFVIINSGVPRKTKDYVEKVANFRKKDPKRCEAILDSIGKITQEAKNCFSKSKINKLGELMNQNQELLEELGVGHPILSKLLDIVSNRALGSKLTGAGGGGCIISLFENRNDAIKIIEEFNREGFQAFLTEYSEVGVKRE